MKRHEGQITLVCKFRDGLPDKILVRPYDRMAVEMPNGMIYYASEKLSSYHQARLASVHYSVTQPYDPFPCSECGKLHDCRLDQFYCCDELFPGETADEQFYRLMVMLPFAVKDLAAVNRMPDFAAMIDPSGPVITLETVQ